MMAFMFYSYLAVDISWKIFKTIFFITKENQIISSSVLRNQVMTSGLKSH